MEILGTLAAVAFGFVLNEAAQWFRHARAEGSQRRNVRMLLWQEIAYNRAALTDYWAKVTALTPNIPQSDEQYFEWRQRLADMPLPVWGRIMFDSNAGLLANALSETGELERTYSLHANWQRFVMLRTKLQEELATPNAVTLAADYARWKVNSQADVQSRQTATLALPQLLVTLNEFNQRTLPLWRECEEIVKAACADTWWTHSTGRTHPVLIDSIKSLGVAKPARATSIAEMRWSEPDQRSRNPN